MPTTLDVQKPSRASRPPQKVDGFAGGHRASAGFVHVAKSKARKTIPAKTSSVAQDLPASKTAGMSIHARIKALRIAAKLTQLELAEAVSRRQPEEPPITRQTVQHWERAGGTAPKRKRLEVVAEVLGVSVAALMVDGPLPQQLLASEPEPRPYVLLLPQAADAFVGAVSLLSPAAWAMVRAALDTVVGHPELRDDVCANVLTVLGGLPSKRAANG